VQSGSTEEEETIADKKRRKKEKVQKKKNDIVENKMKICLKRINPRPIGNATASTMEAKAKAVSQREYKQKAKTKKGSKAEVGQKEAVVDKASKEE
jgi:hypothetical protein